MNVVWAWLRLDSRRRWRSLTVLALLIAVSSGTVLAAVAGARRGESAMDRLAAQSKVSTALVAPNRPGFDWDPVRALPEVEKLGRLTLGMNIPVEEVPEAPIEYVPADADLSVTFEQPAVLEGRHPDPNRPDEAEVQPEYVAKYHKGVGDVVTARLYTPEQLNAAAAGQELGEPAGPRQQIRIVGVTRTVMGELLDVERPQLYTTFAFYRQYRANFYTDGASFTNALVRLRGGEAALPAFEADLARVSGRTDIDIRNMAAYMRRAQRSFTFQARCLLAFAIAALLASLVLVGQAVARYTASGVSDLQALRAVGMTPRQAAGAAVAGPAVAGLAGATGGVVAAGIASRWFPIGSAARMEPAPGVRLDPAILAVGWVAVPLAVLAGALAAAWLTVRAQQTAEAGRRSAVAAAAARAGLPVPVVVGTRFALERGRGRTAVPVRPALIGAAAGVLGIVGAFTFSAGVSDAAGHPARFGQTWQLGLFEGWNDQSFVPNPRALLTAVSRDHDVTGVNDARIGVVHAGQRASAVSLFTNDPIGTPIRFVLTSGRMPSSDAEVALAPNTAALLNASIGSRIPVTGAENRRLSLTVSGIGFVPVGPHNDYDAGGWVRPATFQALFGDGFKFRAALIALRPGAPPKAVIDRLNAVAAGMGVEGAELYEEQVPTIVGELRQVETLPLALGVFLMLLAIGAVGHALATAVRRRRHDVAVLRAVGMTRWQSRMVVVTQASVLACVGLVFGVPLGLALGRTLWRVEADYAPLQYVPPTAILALALVGPLAFVVANLLAAWPGRQAAGLRIGHVLRAE